MSRKDDWMRCECFQPFAASFKADFVACLDLKRLLLYELQLIIPVQLRDQVNTPVSASVYGGDALRP